MTEPLESTNPNQGDDQSPEAPDGAVVPRSELERAIARRQSALERARALESENEKLRAQLADAGAQTLANADAPADTSNLAELQKRLDSLQSQWDQRVAAERRADFESDILGGVKPAALPVARLVIRGLLADGEISTDADPGEIRKSLAAKYPNVFAPKATTAANPAQANQRSHAHITSPAGVEPGDMANVSSEDWRRMIAIGQGPKPLI